MKPALLGLAVALFASLASAHAESPHLALEGTYDFTAGYKGEGCARKIAVKALFDAQTGKPTHLEVFDQLRPNEDGSPMIIFRNDGESRGFGSLGETIKWINTVSDTSADNVEYEYVLGLRHTLSRKRIELKNSWIDGEELHLLLGDICDYKRVN
jgi:hypothetical protein